jgi:hypothetical protein
LCRVCSPHDNDKAISNVFQAVACINVWSIFAGIAQVVEQLICNSSKQVAQIFAALHIVDGPGVLAISDSRCVGQNCAVLQQNLAGP